VALPQGEGVVGGKRLGKPIRKALDKAPRDSIVMAEKQGESWASLDRLKLEVVEKGKKKKGGGLGGEEGTRPEQKLQTEGGLTHKGDRDRTRKNVSGGPPKIGYWKNRWRGKTR